MAPGVKKGLRITGRALKSAARLPVRVSGRSSKADFSPIPGELPIVILKVQVLSCKGLLAKDRNGHSDPFVVVSVLNSRQQTSVAKRTTSPVYAPKDATFEFPIYLSLAEKLGALELVIWDKDMLSKEYLGELAVPLDNWFPDGQPLGFDDDVNKPFELEVLSSRVGTAATGTITIKLGFVSPQNAHSTLQFSEIYDELVHRSRLSLVSAPPTEGVGTVRSDRAGPAFEDDGGLSSDDNSDEEDEDTEATPTSPLSRLYVPPSDHPAKTTVSPGELDLTQRLEKQASVPPALNLQPASPATPTPGAGEKTPKASVPASPRFMPKLFPRRSGLPTSNSYDSTLSTTSPLPSPSLDDHTRTPSGTEQEKEKKRRFRKSGSNNKLVNPGYSLSTENDIVGIVMLEIGGATDLPRLKNMTRTGWDMDPFVVISFGKKVFRTRVIRHSRNPVWNEKLLFHVRRYETAFRIQLSILDWDKLSSNDYIGEASLDVKKLLDSAPQKDPVTGLYSSSDDGDHPLAEFALPLSTAKEMPWEAKHNPVLTFRAKYQPYDALRQHFWGQYLKQYDTDDTGHISHIELTSMLDSLGSTLTHATIHSFFTRCGKDPHTDELTIEQVTQCLETELMRPDNDKRRVDTDTSLDTSVSATPVMMLADNRGEDLELGKLDFSGPAINRDGDDDDSPPSTAGPDPGQSAAHPDPPPDYPTEPGTVSKPGGRTIAIEDAVHVGQAGDVVRKPYRAPGNSYASDAEDSDSESTPEQVPGTPSTAPVKTKSKKTRFKRTKKTKSESSKSKSGSDASGTSASGTSGSEDSVERVINVKNCPLCHRPRLNSKAEIDIVTHLAVCASQDWGQVDRIVVGNFVTASQAQRKWYTKILSKVSSGDYRLGANSANIIVQNRMTGQLEEEKMQVYVRLGIRLLYKGATSRMEGGRARRLLKSLSIKQGVKYDAPESAADIPTFIEFHKLPVEEILDPIDSFKTFNQFFYRKLKPSARPLELPDNPYRLVSVADCRLMTFETVNVATQLWIKGREFTVARLLGDAYRDQADNYVGGALAIFRLAPQDYHRFHVPVDGVIGPMTYIAGEYYTVNPQAIRTALDVYGENARKVVPIDSPQFGRVMAVCIGAMMVGSIKTTVEEGQQVTRGEEFGYFAFGGSTIVLLCEKGVLDWDEDLLINGRASLETLVRVGMGIGTGRRSF